MQTSEQTANVLVVDDDPAVGTVLAALLGQAGIGCRHVTDVTAALAILNEGSTDIVITDLRMPGPSGLDLLEEVASRWSDIPVILLTAHGTISLAVEAMKKGAADFLLKPFDREEILFTVRKQMAAVCRQSRAPSAEMAIGALRTGSAKMREVEELVRRAAGSNATVLLRGESGTGKEVTARAIHESSARRTSPFVKIHCAALPDNLIESELFGYEKGAFTGAASRKLGRVELAEGGTLFLDEIGDVAPVIQVKLLRLLQDREFERLGGTQTLKTTARFVAATHQPLEDLIRTRAFREDLFYRLNVLPIWLPALRERHEDIAALATHFATLFGAANGRQVRIAPEAIDLLASQPWPGNVRQLQNFVERLVILSDGHTLSAKDAQRELERQTAVGAGGPAAVWPKGTLEGHRRSAEREALLSALAKCDNNRSRAARLLGISRRTLYHKLEEYGIA